MTFHSAMNELRPLLPYLRPYRREYLLGLALVVISNFFTTLGPRFLEHGIDALRSGGRFHDRPDRDRRCCSSSPSSAAWPATACASC